MSTPGSQLPPSRPGRHQLKRSLTELTSSSRLRRNPGQLHQDEHRHGDRLQHQHQRLHQPHRHHHSHRKDHSHHHFHEKRASIAPQQPTIHMRHSLDIPRTEGLTPMITPVGSRRPSIMVPTEDSRPAIKEDDPQQERQSAFNRAEGLKQALCDLGDVSATATKRLDETYYSVLEKMSTLQNTITALKDLAETSREIYSGFENDSQSLESDVLTQLSSLGQFSEQQSTIESLQGRITAGRDKVQSLTTRVDTVRERVEGWEQADREWQDKTRKRLRIIWSVMSVIATAVIAVLVGANYGIWGEGLRTSKAADLAPQQTPVLSNMSQRGQPLLQPSWLGPVRSQTCTAVYTTR